MKVATLSLRQLTIYFLLLPVVCIGFLAGAESSAQRVSHSDTSTPNSFVTISENTVRPDTSDNAYIITQSDVLVDTSTVGDIYAVGYDLTVVAPLVGDIGFLGKTVTVSDQISGDIRAFTDYLTLDASVAGELIYIGDALTISESGSVQNDLGVLAERVDLRGVVSGDIYAEGDEVNIYGTVRGTVYAKMVNRITLHPGSRVSGDIVHADHVGALTILDGAVLEGSQEVFSAKTDTSPLRSFLLTLIFFVIVGYLPFVISSRRWNVFLRVPIREGLLTASVGFLTLLLASLLAVGILSLSFVFPGFILVSLGLFLVLMLLIILSVIVAPLFIGAAVQFVYTNDVQITWQTIVIGSFILVVLIAFVPYAPFICVLLCLLFLTGRLTRAFFKDVRK